MSDPGSLIPISDEQSKAIQETAKAFQAAVDVLKGVGGFLQETAGTVPQDVVALLGGDWLKVRRAENLARMIEKARERLKARKIEPEPASLALGLPILIAAADESRDELQDLWARLLAAVADPDRAPSFRIAFIEAAKRMDPLDAAILQEVDKAGRDTLLANPDYVAKRLGVSHDEVAISISNLQKLDLLFIDGVPKTSALGREFLRAVSD